ncbi:MAG: sigma-70 family RNA polymerase sigma factor [Alphaproteobacteria bacterium]
MAEDDPGHKIMTSPDFKSEFLRLLPNLRAFARSLCGNMALADDLTQEALLRAWNNRDSFQPGTNMQAWLFTILRNSFYSSIRKKSREVEDPDGLYAQRLEIAPQQQNGLELKELRHGLSLLPTEQREAIILVGASGYSYEEAATICGCAIGTIKSRVSRARRALMNYMEGRSISENLPSQPTVPSKTLSTQSIAPPLGVPADREGE